MTPTADCYDFNMRPADPISPARLRGLRFMPDAKTILVVDDDVELSDGLRMVLERQGYRVIQARDGQQGQKQVYQQRPDLVILDMMMPRMGGYPVLEHFRDKPDAPPIIMITANEGSRHKAYAEYLGVIDYIRKPFAMERLLEAVERGLKGNDGRRNPRIRKSEYVRAGRAAGGDRPAGARPRLARSLRRPPGREAALHGRLPGVSRRPRASCRWRRSAASVSASPPCANCSRKPAFCWPGAPTVLFPPTPSWPTRAVNCSPIRKPFPALLHRLGLTIRPDDLTYVGSLVTPPFSSLRFDTAFFTADLPPGQDAVVQPGELDAGEWLSADAALRAWEQGRTLLSPPTVSLLETIRGRPMEERGASAKPLFDALAAGAPEVIYFSPQVQMMPLFCDGLPPTYYTNAFLVGRDPAYLIDPGPTEADEQAPPLYAARRSLERGRPFGRRSADASPSRSHRRGERRRTPIRRCRFSPIPGRPVRWRAR